MINPIQGQIRGEAILDGDASGGIPLTLYAMTPGWPAVSTPVTAAEGTVTAATSVFISAMIGSTVTLDGIGSAMIVSVTTGGSVIGIDAPLQTPPDETVLLTMDASESLREVELDADDWLAITDVMISQEKNNTSYCLAVGEDTDGNRVVKGVTKAEPVSVQFITPFLCKSDGGLKYFGANAKLNTCLIHGYIT